MFSKSISNDNDSGIVENSSFDYEDDRANVSHYENISSSKLIASDYAIYASKPTLTDSALHNVSTNQSEKELLSKITAYKNYYDGLLNESLMAKSYNNFISNSSYNKLSENVFDLYQDNSLIWSRNDIMKSDGLNNAPINGLSNSTLRSNAAKFKYSEDPYENHVYENSYDVTKKKSSEVNEEKPIDYSLSNNDKLNSKLFPSEFKSISVNSKISKHSKTLELKLDVTSINKDIISECSIKNTIDIFNSPNQLVERNITPKAQSLFDKGVPKTKKIWREKYIAEDESNVVFSNIKNLEACVTAINHIPTQNNITENSLTPKLIEELKTFRSFINDGTDSEPTNCIDTSEKKLLCHSDVLQNVDSHNHHIVSNSINDNNLKGKHLFNDNEKSSKFKYFILSNDSIQRNISDINIKSDIFPIENANEISMKDDNIESTFTEQLNLKNSNKLKLDFIINSETCLFHCPHCSYGAVKKTQLKRHLGIHSIFICTHCGENFDQQTLLVDHVRINHPNRSGRKMCKKCNMLFRAEDLEAHLDGCTGVKAGWDCKICFKNFKFLSTLSIHMEKWHKNIVDNKSFSVSRGFVENNSLNLSSQKSNNFLPKDDKYAKNFFIENTASITTDAQRISAIFNNEESQNLHGNSNLENCKNVYVKRTIKIFNCIKCSKNYKSKQSLEKHILSKHGGESILSKSVIEVSVPSSEKVDIEKDLEFPNNVIKYAKHVCKLFNCFRKFHSLERLLRHEETHNVEKHEKCDWPGCSKSYLHAENLEIHRQQHTSIKPHKCIQCNLAYWQKCSLRSHQQRMHKNMVIDDLPEINLQIGSDAELNEKQNDCGRSKVEDKVGKRFPCEFCSHILKSNKRLIRHLKLKHADLNSPQSKSIDVEVIKNPEIILKECRVDSAVKVHDQNDEDTIDHLDGNNLCKNKKVTVKQMNLQKEIDLPLVDHMMNDDNELPLLDHMRVCRDDNKLKNIEEVYEFNEKKKKVPTATLR